MDIMLFAVSFFTVVVTLSGGYWLIQKLFPARNREIEITNAFRNKDYGTVIELTEGKEEQLHSLNIYSFAAQSRAKTGQHADAVAWWNRALVKVHLNLSDQIFVELEIGDAFLALNDFKQAEIHYRAAVTLSPLHEKASYKLGNLLFLEKKYEACRKLIRPILKVNPSLIDMRKLYAECLASMDLYAKAIRHYGLLERHNEEICTYNYAKTLKKLKIWDKAYSMYSKLLANTSESSLRDLIIRDLIKISISLKKYHNSLGMIEKYLPEIKSLDIKLELKYMRATIFFLRGDQMIALKEYTELYKEKPFYKDLASIVEQYEHWLKYTFLFNYFTSNESVFESLITRILLPGISIVRRTPFYFMVLRNNTISIFYRDMRKITGKMLKEIEHIVVLNYKNIEVLEVWSLLGIEGTFTISGHEYRFILRTDNDFLVQINTAVSQMKHVEGGEPLNFVEGFKDVSEVIPIEQNNNQREQSSQNFVEFSPLFDSIINTENSFIEDEFISKALE